MIETILAATVGVVVGGVVAGWWLQRVRHFRRQLIAFGAAVALLPVVAVVAGLEMLSAKDVLAAALIGVAAAGSAVGIAVLVAQRVAGRIEGLRAASERLAEGDWSVRVTEDGPDELRELAAAFNDMASTLSRQFETRRNLVAWATHDLRTPLASLQAMIEALEDDLAEPSDYLPRMSRQVRALSGLVDDLFELSRIETGTLPLDMADVPLAELATGCVRSLGAEAESRGVTLEVARADAGAVARCAPDKVERVLMNLLTNALRHTPHDGAVAVQVLADESAVTVAVEDTGTGLPAGSTERVFESFWRADRSRTSSTEGAGLGLAIARGLVEAHGGRIWAENRPGGGARFCFTLPAA